MTDFLNSTRRSIAWIKEKATEGALIIHPPFQRNPVWTDKQKAYLVDTILRGYPIPELYMTEEVDADGQQRHTVVDGQQRIRACLEFIESKFSLMESDDTEWDDLKFSELRPELKKRFYGYNFIVRQLPDLPEEELRHIFSRLNKNVVVLNKQELRHSTYGGKFISLMEEIADFDYWSGTRIFSPNDVRRMLDVEFISEIAIACLHGPQNKKLTIDKWYASYEDDFEEYSRLKSLFLNTLNEIDKIIPIISATRWRKKSDFYSLFLSVAKYEDALSFSSDVRTCLSRDLVKFGKQVDLQLSQGGVEDERVRTYSRAVERAASDLTNRRIRNDVLGAVISKCLSR